MMQDSKLDITQFCTTFPQAVDGEILRESLVLNIRDILRDKQVIIVEGGECTGKTTLLAQFASIYKMKTFSYFLTPGYWAQDKNMYLLEMCEQMREYIQTHNMGAMADSNYDLLGEHQLKEQYFKLIRLIAKAARSGQGPFYFVIDGINYWLKEESENELLSLLPLNIDGIGLLMSSISGMQLPESIRSLTHAYMIQPFSKLEAEKYFDSFLNLEQVGEVYSSCDGMIGYLSEIRRQCLNGMTAEVVLHNLQPGYHGLLERQWNKLDISELGTLIIAVLIFSPEKLASNHLAEILGKNQEIIQAELRKITFLRIANDGMLLFEAGYESFARSKVLKQKTSALQLLITYNEAHNQLANLSELYCVNNNYDKLFALVQPEALQHLLIDGKRISFVRHTLRSVSEMAYKQKDWFRLAWSGLAESIFTKLITSPIMVEEQVKALLSLERREEAIVLAQSCILAEDRLKIFAVICRHMREKACDIPHEVLTCLEDAVSLFDCTVELANDDIQEKVLDVCADIFPIRADLAIELLEKVARDTGRDHYNDRLMDLLTTQLLLRLGPDSETSQMAISHIKDDTLKDFVVAAPATIKGVSAQDVLSQVYGIKDNSAKLFMLQAWCNQNSHDNEAHIVVKCALDIMISSEEYSPTQLHLRQFAEPLKYCSDLERVQELVTQIDLLKGTGLKNPIDESSWLELQLAIIEKRWCLEAANKRLQVVLDVLEEDIDLDTRCMVLSRILLLLPDVLSQSDELMRELEDQLVTDFLKLMQTSAEQLKICKKMLGVVTLYKHQLAREFAQLLNTTERRYIALAEILRVYTQSDSQTVDFQFVADVLDDIEYVPYKDWVFVQVIRRLSHSSQEGLLYFYERIIDISSPPGRALGCAYYLHGVKDLSASLKDSLAAKIQSALEEIDPLWERIRIGFNIVNIISDSYRELATIIFQKMVNFINESMFCETRVSTLYIEACKTAIRLVPDIVKSKDGEEWIRAILNAVSTIPSVEDKCQLLSELGLKCTEAVSLGTFEKIEVESEKILKQLSDSENMGRALAMLSPLLFKRKTAVLLEYLELVPEEARNEALVNVVHYIFNKTIPGEEFDSKSLGKIDYFDAKNICEHILPHMTTDVTIYNTIADLTEMMIDVDKNSREKLHFVTEKQSLTILKKMFDAAHDKLPDKRNIEHDGYLIACKIAFARLKEAAKVSRYCRNQAEWDKMAPDWMGIVGEIEEMDNTSDKVFVLSLAGESAYKNDKHIGEMFLKKAEVYLESIDNNVDRAHRYECVAEAYNKCSDKRSAEFLVKEAMKFAACCSATEGRDQLMGRIVELAHSVDETLSTTIASRVDDPNCRAYLEDNLRVLSLHSNPASITNYKKSECQRFLKPAFKKILRTMSSNFCTTQKEEVIAEWIYKSLGRDYDTINLAVFWLLENNIRVNSQSKVSTLSGFASYQANLLDIIKLVGNAVLQLPLGDKPLIGECGTIKFFKQGKREEALAAIHQWLCDNVKDYLTIYDPYLDEKDIDILKVIPQQSRVTILKAAFLKDWEDMPTRFKRAWQNVCHQSPPDTIVYVFMNKNRKTPLHDRFLLTNHAGLKLGTSLNGLGNKDATISFLDENEKMQVEYQLVDPLILRAPKDYEGDELIRKVFNLG